MNAKDLIQQGKTALGIEFGSTRIKGVLIDYDGNVLATGGHEWENSLVEGVWTYALKEVDDGLRACYTALRRDVEEKYGVTPANFGAIGVSAMMHGYIALGKDDRQIAKFQTWRNTNATAAADELTELFQYNIPLRRSVAHLYQRMLDQEDHVKNVASVFTLAAYIHYKLTEKKVIGIGDAAGMFPIDSGTLDYDEGMVQKFDALTAKHGYSIKLREVFPAVLVAGDDAGNLSAGTSTFAMVVPEKQLSKLYREIDMVTTPFRLPLRHVPRQQRYLRPERLGGPVQNAWSHAAVSGRGGEYPCHCK